MIACPACGLPAELIYRFSRDLGQGPVEHARTRCVLLHFSSVPIEDLHVRAPDPAATDIVQGMQGVQSSALPAGRVLSFPAAAPAPLGSRLRDWTRHLVWFLFGALAAVLGLRAPAAIVLLPLAVPLLGIAAARRSWQPLAPRVKPVPLAPRIQPDEPGREAA
jgi:hypothetical protein